MIAPDGLKVGEKVMSGEDSDIKVGNSLPLKLIPVGYLVHNVESSPGKGAVIARSAGTVVQVMAHEFGYVLLRMPSGEVRRILENCKATIGQVGNLDHKNQKLGKAGRNVHRGRRPTVRGLVMNPNDHPHGGGEGKTGVGMKHPKTPWGKPALGKRTRKTKQSDKNKMSRSIKKGPFVDSKLLKKVLRAKNEAKSNQVINTWSRSSTIIEEMLNLTIGVHNGRKHIPIFITENMIGHKLGEFSPTRVFKGHSSKSDRLG